MSDIVIEHVPVAELPPAWQAKLPTATGATVTVRIEPHRDQSADAGTANPLFGMWRDREDMADVAGYIRSIRADRFGDGSTDQR